MTPEEITPSDQKAFMESAKIPDAKINNGPLVYNLTQEASLNGIDPNCYTRDGVCSDRGN